MQTASGLAAAHAQGLVHRDVKPANILLADGIERVKLTDFGLARAADDASLTRTGIIAGTPQYMSPEQARGEFVDQRSDLFSLGSVLYAMCTGRVPFRAETSYGVLRRITDDEPQSILELNPKIPAWLCDIVSQLMSKDPDGRLGSAREVAELLERCLAHVQQPTVVPLPEHAVSLRKKNSKPMTMSRRTIGVAMFAALSLGLLSMLVLHASEAPDISGTWTNSEFGAVVLKAMDKGTVEGNYVTSNKEREGRIQLKWSRVEGRFNGTWKEGDDRLGTISLHLVNDEIRGARVFGKRAEIAAGTPNLAEFIWERAGKPNPLAKSDPSKGSSGLTRARHFLNTAYGEIAYSAQGRFVGIASRNPAWSGSTAKINGAWKPEVNIIDARFGTVLFRLNLTSEKEDKLLELTNRIPRCNVTSIDFSPDEELVAVGTSIGQIKLFNTKTGALVLSLNDEKERPDDKTVNEELRSLQRAMGGVKMVRFSPTGKSLAACGNSFSDVRLVASNSERLGRSGTGPGRLKLWDVKTGVLQHDLAGHNNHANSIAFSPDGKNLASSGRWESRDDYGTGVIIWNVASGNVVRKIETNDNGGTASVAYSPDGKLIAIGSQRFDNDNTAVPSSGAVVLVHAATGIADWLQNVPVWANSVAFSPDGKNVIVLCGNRQISGRMQVRQLCCSHRSLVAGLLSPCFS
jgi:WD40 repeat protein